MKGWFHTLRLGAIALFLLVMGGRMLDEGKPWQEHFERIFVKQAR